MSSVQSYYVIAGMDLSASKTDKYKGWQWSEAWENYTCNQSKGKIQLFDDPTYLYIGYILAAEDENWRETAKKWYKAGKMYRIKGISWWEQELPTQKEMDNGIKNLERVGNKVDYIITHSPSASVIALLGHGLYEQDVLTRYLEDIRSKVEYKKHFCGHMHVDKAVNEKDIILYEQIIRLA